MALGSNLGSRLAHLRAAFDALGELSVGGELACSRIYETDPVGPGAQRAYLNAVVRMRPTLEPRPLLEALLAIEASRGRERGPQRHAARTLDLDLLLYGERRIDEPGLIVPHPRLAERAFVLEPLCDLDPEQVVPGTGAHVAQLAAAVRDPAAVRLADHPEQEEPAWPSPPSASRP